MAPKKASKKAKIAGSQWIVLGNSAYSTKLRSQTSSPCCNFYLGAGGALGVWNSCTQCKIAVVSGAGGVSRYRVAPHSGVPVRATGGQMLIVDELNC
jgi:hypothetical protein